MELNHKVFGSGPPVIILHGLFGMLDNWQTIAKKLADDFTVFIVDQRNHGRSPRIDSISYGEMAADLAAFMENNWIHSAHIVGHSMGGKTAMQFAMDFPEMTESLSVIDISPSQSKRGHDEIFEALLSVNIKNLAKRSDAHESLSKFISEEGIKQFLLKNLTRRKEGGYEWKMNLPIIHENYERILDPIISTTSFDGRVLFIKGGRSKHIVKSDYVLIKQLFPNYLEKEISEAGHWVHADAPLETLTILKEFLT